LFFALAFLGFTGCTTLPFRGGNVVHSNYFTNWSAGAAPADVGRRVAENFAARQFEFETNSKRKFVIYPEVCAWYGSLEVARLTGDRPLQAELVHRLRPLYKGPLAGHISTKAHVDSSVFGVVPLEIYLETKEPRIRDRGLVFADAQWTNATPDGITGEARYWVDDMYMITALQVQAFRATRDTNYLDRATRTMTAYLDRLQQPNGLFFHGTNAPFYWSRGNGWAAAGMTELLRELPKDHPQRARIMEGYKKTMAALLKCQGDDGLWPELLDHPEAWSETSSSGMFDYALITGVKKGWLDEKTYGPAARAAWLGLVAHLDKDANVDSVCEGTNKGDSADYYLKRGRKTGDLHGQAAVLWAAAAMQR
jgi:rhamnogalacturonyl hydrolase YesR